ncbi:MAG: tetratricopeptide repeat protein [Actinobacteria bacterium]|nr:tetratricopeptide repeat protein [Actinomycetota bacterium]
MNGSGAGTERKVVTALFADLAGSTELAGRLDPERLREVMGAFYGAASEVLDSLRGRVEKFVGDAVMAVFGLPHAHEDDALRAVRAGLSIRERTARLGEEMGVGPLAVRVGVASGPVAAGVGPGDQFLVSGPTVNLAARLERAAGPGEVLVAETTWQLTEHAVAFGERRSVEARGFEGEVGAWPVRALGTRSTRRTIPLVGRRRELALLRDAFDRARESRRSHLVTLLGEPGIGKTRLADELVAGLPDEVEVLSGRATDYGERPTFSPVAEMVRRVLSIDEEAPDDLVRTRLHEVVTGCCDPTESEQVVGRLGLALGLAEEPAESHRFRDAEIRAGFSLFVEGLARTRPVVLVFDDLHVARPPLLELIEEVVRRARRVPLLVLCLAREDLLEHRAGWGGGIPDALTIRIDPLSPEDAAALAVSAGEGVDAPRAQRIALHAGGNPFFIVETTGMMLHEHVDDQIGAPHSHVLPPTVQAVVASRIDHLPSEARELFRKASALAGSRFHVSELAPIADAKEDVLAVLEEAELLLPDEEGPGRWRFRHELLRDVAYESLAKRERLRLHGMLADRLAGEGEERHRRAIAYHLEQAARASLDLDPRDRSVAERAIPALALAGDAARWRMESRSAIDLYERALALAGPEQGWGPREGRILSSIGEARYWLGEYGRAVSSLRRALDMSGGDTWVRTHALRFLGDIALNVDGDADRATEMFDRALDAAREHGEPYALARTLLMAGWAPYWKDDLPGARAMFEEALETARSNGDGQAEARALTSLISVTSPVGDELECLALGERALAVAREDKDAFSVAVARGYLANSLRRMMRLDEALDHAEEALRIYGDLGARWEVASTLGDLAEVLRLLGRYGDAERRFAEALEICLELGERSLTSWTVEMLVLTRSLAGDGEGAGATLREHRAELEREPGAQVGLAFSEATVAIRAGDEETFRERALLILDHRRRSGHRNHLAAAVWWTGRVLGPEAVGGEEALDEARATLEAAHWAQALVEPELYLERVVAPAAGRAPTPS